ncbi:MAG: sigma-54 dependent transcriptional regulator [Lentisphaerae bacterium]|nr:sigma-54 dependent transcriptional regulator [Lentisphaerota bacterium]
MGERILIIDDEPLIRWSLRERMQAEGFDVSEAPDGQTAKRAMERETIDLILLDLRLPDVDGMTLLGKARAVLPQVPVIMMTAFSTIATAVEAIKLGAYDYVSKPFNMDELALVVKRALEAAALQQALHTRIDAEKEKFGLLNLVGTSAAMREIAGMIRKVTRSSSTTVLLRGESGTGKDLIARVIHYESDRANQLFMNVTCTALPDALLESELFGHEKGAFTDAKSQKKGLFEVADGGTVFLDEIGDMSPTLQSKLLQVLEYKAFKRVGGSADIEVDVRIIAATNRDLESAVKQQAFREDLYYRFNVLPVFVPPLRERREDIPILAEHFLSQLSRDMKREDLTISPDAIDKMEQYDWPGNVRELRNVIERAILLCETGNIETDDILVGKGHGRAPAHARRHAVLLPEKGCSLDEVEKELVRQAITRTSGNRTRAAELLGISRDQVRYKMEKHGLGGGNA